MSHRTSILAAFLTVLACGPLVAQDHHADTTAYPAARMDSAVIRRLPVVRSAEISSWLPGSVLGVGYEAFFSGAVAGQDVRVDGVPIRNFTNDRSALLLTTDAIADLSAEIAGSSVQSGNPVALRYTTISGGTTWHAFGRAATDNGLTGAIDNVRAAAGASGPIGRALRLAVTGSAQSADHTEFNNLGDVQLYGIQGVDTVITYDPNFTGEKRQVVVPEFVEIEQNRLPASGWNEMTGSARLDFMPTSSVAAFASAHVSRLQTREPFGGGCVPCAMFLSTAQRGDRSDATLVTLGLDLGLGAHTTGFARLARANEFYLNSVLASGESGLFSEFEFIADDETFPIDDALIERVLRNQPQQSPFPSSRTDLAVGVEYRLNPYGVMRTFGTRGALNGEHFQSDESRLFGLLGIRTQRSAHRLTVGMEASRIDASLAQVAFRGDLGPNVWKEAPMMASAFVEDVIKLGGTVVQGGLRYDRFDPNAQFPVTPGYINLDDPSSLAAASTSGVLSPRLAVASSFGSFLVHGSAGRSATMPSLATQFNGKNSDFFRFRNSNTGQLFSGQLEMVKYTSLNAGAVYAGPAHVSFEANFFHHETSDGVSTRFTPWQDPTNPGTTTYLRTVVNGANIKVSGIDAGVQYTRGPGNFGRLGMSRERLTTTATHTVTAVTGLLQLGDGVLPADLDLTLGLRALAPDHDAETSWLTRFDLRLAKSVDLGGIRGTFFVDGLRLIGATPYMTTSPDAHEFFISVESDRLSVGCGALEDAIDLHDPDLFCGIRNEVDLQLLRRAEARFGNGDRIFTATEQSAAFLAAARMAAAANAPTSQSRRIVIGAQLSF